MPDITLFLHVAVLLLTLFAAAEDIWHLRLRNTISVAVAVLFAPMIFILPYGDTVQHLACGIVIFAIVAGMYFAKLLGGGDAKLIAAVALWVDLHHLPMFLIAMTFAGGILALISMGLKHWKLLPKIAQKTPDNGWLASLARGETVVPYGVAIAVGTALTFF